MKLVLVEFFHSQIHFSVSLVCGCLITYTVITYKSFASKVMLVIFFLPSVFPRIIFFLYK